MVNRRLTGVIALVIAAMLILSQGALAELKRGDRGYAVTDLQQLLFETGWLFELPDGVFGKNTEKAVKDFEKYADLPVDGIADDDMIYELAVSLATLNEENGIVSEYFGEYPPGYFFDLSIYDEGFEDCFAALPDHCIQSTDPTGSTIVEFCEWHHTLHVETYFGMESGNIDEVRASSDVWLEEVERLYDHWASLLQEEERESIMVDKSAYSASIELHRKAAGFLEKSDENKLQTEVGIARELRNQAAWLCGMIRQLEIDLAGSGNAAGPKSFVLNGSTIISGDNIYYSGVVNGVDKGVYIMKMDGSERRKLTDMDVWPLAESNGNLLVWHFDESGETGLKVLGNDGAIEMVAYSTNGHAIAHEGRFYYGGSVVGENGYDHNWLMESDPQRHDLYWPLAVVGDYICYIDANGTEAYMYTEGNNLPSGEVNLIRLSLSTGEIDHVSGRGTKFIGIENGMAFYERRDYMAYTEAGGEFIVDVDDGLYCMDLEYLCEMQLAEITDSEFVHDRYGFISDGVIYGQRYDYRGGETKYEILRFTASGEQLPSYIIEDEDTIRGLCVHDGVFYGLKYVYNEGLGDYYGQDCIVTVDFETGEKREIYLEPDEAMDYTESLPRIAVVGDRIIYSAMDADDGREFLRSIRTDGSDKVTLAFTETRY